LASLPVLATVYPELAAIVGPNIPGHRGLFKRGYGGKSADLGTVQSEVMPEHHHHIGSMNLISLGYTSGVGMVFVPPVGLNLGMAYSGNQIRETTEELRPTNTVVRYLMRALR
jgi:hypothetical protein